MLKRVMALSKQESARLIGCALGDIPADLVIRGGKLVNMSIRGELFEGGGIAVVDRGETLEMLELPLGGLCSLQPWHQVGAALRRIHQRLKKMGSSFDKPIFALNFLPFVTLPELRITARGLVRAKERKIVSLFDD